MHKQNINAMGLALATIITIIISGGTFVILKVISLLPFVSVNTLLLIVSLIIGILITLTCTFYVAFEEKTEQANHETIRHKE